MSDDYQAAQLFVYRDQRSASGAKMFWGIQRVTYCPSVMKNVYGYSETWVLGPRCRHTKYVINLSMYPTLRLMPTHVDYSNPKHVEMLRENVEDKYNAIARLLRDGVEEIACLVCSAAGIMSKAMFKKSDLQVASVDPESLSDNPDLVQCQFAARLGSISSGSCTGWNFMTRLLLWLYKIPLTITFSKDSDVDMTAGNLQISLNSSSPLNFEDLPICKLAKRYLSKHFVATTMKCGNDSSLVDLSKFKLVESDRMKSIRKRFLKWEKN